MPGRRPKPVKAKIYRSYTIDDAAALYECHRNTVANWVSEGLLPIDDHYPIMFHGTTLNAFHRHRLASSKRPCGPGEIYCVVCRSPQRPAGGMVDYEERSGSVGTVVGICPACGRLLHQAVGTARLRAFMERCSVSVRPVANALGEPAHPANGVNRAARLTK